MGCTVYLNVNTVRAGPAMLLAAQDLREAQTDTDHDWDKHA